MDQYNWALNNCCLIKKFIDTATNSYSGGLRKVINRPADSL